MAQAFIILETPIIICLYLKSPYHELVQKLFTSGQLDCDGYVLTMFVLNPSRVNIGIPPNKDVKGVFLDRDRT